MSEVIYFIEESVRFSEKSPVFMLKDLKSMYSQILVEQGVNQYIHSTRFKDCLLESIPGLCESRSGRDILLSLDGAAGRALFEACSSSCMDDSIILAKAAHIVRDDLFKQTTDFNCDLSRAAQSMSVPYSMQQLIELILEGSNSKSVRTKQVANNVSQLLKFNSVKTKRRKVEAQTRHSKSMETPLPVAIGLFLHNKTRKRSLVDFFAKEGLSISHTRVDEIEDHVVSNECMKYQNLGFVCPTSLQDGFFTTAAIDN